MKVDAAHPFDRCITDLLGDASDVGSLQPSPKKKRQTLNAPHDGEINAS